MALDRVLGLPEFSIGLYTPILVLKNFSRPLAFLAEAAVRVVKVPRSALHPLPANETWHGCVQAEFSWNDSSVALLDAEKLLGLEEASALRDFTSFTQNGAAAFAPNGGRPA
ncbi:MAG: hypothetical protein EOP11_11505 [Proteobacteria bacterium]|nr:MAG: hypothetical protein EOP11_11505 [Pseudomonadota bacterium]